jgi:hypothetical protein
MAHPKIPTRRHPNSYIVVDMITIIGTINIWKGKRRAPNNATYSQALYSLQVCIEISAHTTPSFYEFLETNYMDLSQNCRDGHERLYLFFLDKKKGTSFQLRMGVSA